MTAWVVFGRESGWDTYWRKELQTLNAALADSSTYQEYEGKFDKATQKFTLTEGVKFFPNYSKGDTHHAD